MTDEVAEPSPEAAFDAMEFDAAFRRYCRAADSRTSTRDRSFLLMQGARSLQMAENWRAQSGTWELLANELGFGTGDGEDARHESLTVRRERYRNDRRGRFAQFVVISDVEWQNPNRGDGLSYSDAVDCRRHQQAWCYRWAAEAAEAHDQYADAARLYRRAGVAWEKSNYQQRSRRAAEAYYRAAVVAAQSSRLPTRSFIVGNWCPSCLREKQTEVSCPADHHALRDEGGIAEDPESDLERLVRCWTAVSESESTDAGYGAMDEAVRQLQELQQVLAANGNKAVARIVYQRHKKLSIDISPRWLSMAPSRASWHFSRAGSDLRRLFVWLALFYLVILPIAWQASGVVSVAGSVRSGPSIIEAVVFSGSTALTLSTGHFAGGGVYTNALQALEAMSSFFALGYALWISQRSYAD